MADRANAAGHRKPRTNANTANTARAMPAKNGVRVLVRAADSDISASSRLFISSVCRIVYPPRVLSTPFSLIHSFSASYARAKRTRSVACCISFSACTAACSRSRASFSRCRILIWRVRSVCPCVSISLIASCRACSSPFATSHVFTEAKASSK